MMYSHCYGLILALTALGHFHFSEGFVAIETRGSTSQLSSSLPSSLRRISSIQDKQQDSALNLLAKFPPRGGALKPASRGPAQSAQPTSLSASTSGDASGEASSCPFTKFMTGFGAFWGSFGVIYILARAISRVLPIALEPLSSSLILSPAQWCAYALSCILFAYAEGYKGFHKKFSPLVVKRSFTLVIGTRQGNNPLNYLFAPLYSMGLWGATKKRAIVSWGVTTGVALLVAIVKRLPQAPRCILDAGVVVGLTIGSASILYHFATSLLTGKLPDVDACLPNEKQNTN